MNVLVVRRKLITEYQVVEDVMNMGEALSMAKPTDFKPAKGSQRDYEYTLCNVTDALAGHGT